MSHERPDPTRVYAPPGANITLPENPPPPGMISPGLAKNLREQLESIFRHCNEKSFKTRSRYLEASIRFSYFLADRYRLQKFKNVDDRHFRAYAEYLKEMGFSPATIQAELAGIRFFYRQSGGKNKLSDNRSLNLPKRAVGVENRAWLPEEKEKAVAIATRMGRTDVVIAIDLAYELGLRLEEICVTRVEFLISANKTGIFVVPKGKGGQRRAIKLNPMQRAMIAKYLDYAKAMGLQPGDYLISGSEKHGVKMEIKSLQNWMSHNREKFMVKDRDKIVETDKKKRHATISWHGLRHSYAQKTYAEALRVKPKQAEKIVSENLGHHRCKVTRIYLAEVKVKKKPK
ncbi:MAG: tyrosine-type recombinase/integrase [Oscillospiraceae bacterium]|nr:tyrosine-type recombinase/integrase [Oscillospiraceae bacterium]